MEKHVLFIAGNARSLVANRGDLIAEMQLAGHKVSAVVPIEDMLDSVHDLGIEVHPLRLARTGRNPIQDLGTVLRLYKLIKAIVPDVTFAYNIKPVVWGTLAARLGGVPERYSMITGLGTNFVEADGIKARLMRAFLARLYRIGVNGSRTVFFQNPDDLRDFIDLGVMKDARKAILTMGSGVNLDQFPRTPLPAGPMTFVLIARLLHNKGVREFCTAARAVRAEWPEARFVVVGPHDPSLPHAVAASELASWQAEGIVEFTGGVRDVRPHLARATVFVLPSYYREGQPRSALEAMAMGRALIMSDSPGCRETVRDGENGLLVPPRDASALADAMVQLLTRPELVRRMADASYARAVNEYDARKVNRGILKTMGL
ncbi:glycosyltransferase family 4 protein [Rhodobacteraceae bacterium 2376]|uniref:Glycosyltransferase family 4 protein n=1 Tax=Rhabdonatronobacter sediminivivens TaxID=2743469 RepID=A0A7Z0L2M9_9RHOB|nr:glycosyltransferase family 4 protein [Rhabdonatronobacter sediminivivens]NYS26558.1 glycosyltransferase family 4 protein [Rhabdonatronobacter sediminivivens]